jgi:hypothetical protein
MRLLLLGASGILNLLICAVALLEVARAAPLPSTPGGSGLAISPQSGSNSNGSGTQIPKGRAIGAAVGLAGLGGFAIWKHFKDPGGDITGYQARSYVRVGELLPF